MQIGSYRFDRVEFAGSLGDLGTLIPLAIGLVTLNGLSFSAVFLWVGLFYLVTGFYYKLPIPVQPLKLVSAIAIAFPEKISLAVISATGLLFGGALIILAFTGLIDQLARLFTKPIVRGIQLGLGLILMIKGIEFINRPELLLNNSDITASLGGLPINTLLGLVALVLVLSLISSRRFPAALVIVTIGIIVAIPFGSLDGLDWRFGPSPIELVTPEADDFFTALFLLVIPQLPLTMGNAIIGTTDTAKNLFGTGEATARVSNRHLSFGMGLANLFAGLMAAMPVCHGAGGLAAHYRFGARTGGSNIMIGLLFILIALGFGGIGIILLSAIPNAVLGVLLLFAGLELALLIRDITERRDLFIAFLIAGIGLATSNMSIAFVSGIIVSQFLHWRDIDI
ncbi:putative sulfate/molybdate transporter [Sedimenticola selenatireducens]|uniref:Sulfate permease n=1 Tax=Sedimenticola selenatireducens TaxID=191960 RepID=A0A558DL27_9GAMM|nr:putative sulfate/molybdate transporter [Sedimenticola selenatireducens]TVO70064.1 sulfate permease [Sedimenticola selenatireducens]TVT61694.1 MAG: sulfate permease [Sedimenticola selenatireducens]